MKFFKIFDKISPPSFLDVPYFSVVFSDISIRALILDKKNKKPLLHKEIILEAGIIESGVIKNADKLKTALQGLNHFAPTPFVHFAIPDEVSYVFTAEIPVFPGKSAEEGVAFVLEENVPLSLGEAVFDFMPKKIQETETGFSAAIVATAVASPIIDSYVEVLKAASLEPILCVNESQAIAQAVVPGDWAKAAIISYIHTESVGTYATSGRVVEYSSIAKIPEGGNYVQIVISELSNALKYCVEHRKENDNQPVKCFICGRYEMCAEAMKEVGRLDGLNPLLADVWANAFSLEKYVPDISFENSLRFASAIGLYV